MSSKRLIYNAVFDKYREAQETLTRISKTWVDCDVSLRYLLEMYPEGHEKRPSEQAISSRRSAIASYERQIKEQEGIIREYENALVVVLNDVFKLQ